MTTKPLLLLAALTLCCCISSLHAFSQGRCICIRTISTPVPFKTIKKVEIIPVSGGCRRTEIIITRRNGSKLCVNPKKKWVIDLLSQLQSKNENSATTSSTHF
ncbi:C-X-C motif chemokine 11-1 [Anoplopoma fimbria]|uniref:C-X-C motif chemokine 11-1 n=1 Tax=Anoplopoma fimbria TaxID=229290 RepID=UPI0023EAC12F|nr:C-X-C motif chemokine 11-1 [Anoplopoma fimbria]